MNLKLTKTHADNPYDVDYLADEMAPAPLDALKQIMTELQTTDKQATRRAAAMLLEVYLGEDMRNGIVVSARQISGVFSVTAKAKHISVNGTHLGYDGDDHPEDIVLTRSEKAIVASIDDETLLKQLRQGNLYRHLAEVWPIITRGVKYGLAVRVFELAKARGEHVNRDTALGLLIDHSARHNRKPKQ